MQVFALPNHGESGKIKLALPKSGRWLAPGDFPLANSRRVINFLSPSGNPERGERNGYIW